MPHPLSTSLRLKRLHPDALLPKQATPGSAGLDLCACLPDGEISLAVGDRMAVPCGFAMSLDAGYEAQVRPRSGLALKKGITIPNAPGTIDSDFREELKVILRNDGNEPFTIRHGDRIAQMVVAAVARASILEVEELDQTTRTGGFGSTGTT
jgi:dUTP pyrophosphatase